MPCSSIGAEMSANPSIPAPAIRYEVATPRAHPWRAMRDWLRRLRVQPGEPAIAGCFGALTVKDRMVVKGLAASLECSAERGDDRW
jgi:hypothetical protein